VDRQARLKALLARDDRIDGIEGRADVHANEDRSSGQVGAHMDQLVSDADGSRGIDSRVLATQ